MKEYLDPNRLRRFLLVFAAACALMLFGLAAFFLNIELFLCFPG